MIYPDSVLAICNRSIDGRPDVRKAIDWAARAIRGLPEYETFVSQLVYGAIENCVYEARHKANCAMRQQLGDYSKPPKVVSGSDEAVARVAAAVYTYRIAGTVLGLLTGAELPALADTEAARAGGHAFNAALCRRLAQIVPEKKTVRDSISEKKLREIFQSVQAGEATSVTELTPACKKRRRKPAAV